MRALFIITSVVVLAACTQPQVTLDNDKAQKERKASAEHFKDMKFIDPYANEKKKKEAKGQKKKDQEKHSN